MALILLPAAGLGAELPSSRLGGKSAAGDGEDHAGVLGPGQTERQRELLQDGAWHSSGAAFW